MRQAAEDLPGQLVPSRPRGRLGFLWPGFGDNARVLKWIIERLEGTGEGVDTPVGIVPAPGALDTTGLDMTEEDVAKALEVNAEEWATELGLIEEWLAKFGDNLPSQMQRRTRHPQGEPRELSRAAQPGHAAYQGEGPDPHRGDRAFPRCAPVREFRNTT
jgi:hypothetical protein